MKLSYVRSDAVYKKIMEAPVEKKNDIYRYELMMPFKGKWDCYQIPMKAATPNGYDIIMASDMLGLISPQRWISHKKQILRAFLLIGSGILVSNPFGNPWNVF